MRRDLKLEAWFEDEMVVVVPRTHEWAGQSNISIEDLLSVSLVMRERGSGSRRVVEQGLQRAGIRLGALKIVMELDSTEAILSCVEAGLGIGFASIWAVDRPGREHSLAKIRIEGHLLTRSFSFVLPAAPNLSATAAVMKQFLREFGNGVNRPVQSVTSSRARTRIRGRQ